MADRKAKTHTTESSITLWNESEAELAVTEVGFPSAKQGSDTPLTVTESLKQVTLSASNSRQRIIDYGEVFTPPELVKGMLELIAHECERVDSRFLEPACGNGNFLSEVLRRRLALVDLRFKTRTQWEPNALLGLACLYGIEILQDNVTECRNRLYDIFADYYSSRFGDDTDFRCLDSARYIIRCNILHGDALKMTSLDRSLKQTNSLVFTEWSLLRNGRFKRRLYEYRDLSHPEQVASNDLFTPASSRITDEEGTPVYIPCMVAEMRPLHYLLLGRSEQLK